MSFDIARACKSPSGCIGKRYGQHRIGGTVLQEGAPRSMLLDSVSASLSYPPFVPSNLVGSSHTLFLLKPRRRAVRSANSTHARHPLKNPQGSPMRTAVCISVGDPIEEANLAISAGTQTVTCVPVDASWSKWPWHPPNSRLSRSLGQPQDAPHLVGTASWQAC